MMAKILNLKEHREKKFEKKYQYDLEHDTFKTLDQRTRDDTRHLHNLMKTMQDEWPFPITKKPPNKK